MAKKTKNSNLSLEERLEQALIPNWDEPYKLPENWCWTHWGNCGQFIAGGAFKEKYQGFLGLPIPFYKVGSLKYSNNKGYLYDETNTIDEEIRNQLKVSLIPVNSIIFAKIGEAIRLNRRSLNTIPCCIDNNLMAFVTSDKCYYKYVYYWSKSIDLYEYANATTVPAIRKSDLESIPFPLAPYETQIKIVNQIESLFAKLDEAKEKAQEVLDSFETRKASILHNVFEGNLTEKWREELNIENALWAIESLSNVCVLRSGTTIPAEEELAFGQIPYIKVSDMNLPENSIQITTSSRFVNTCPKSHLIPYGSTIFPKRGGAILTNKKRFVGVDKIIADLNTMAIIPDLTKLKGWYCYYWMLSVDLRKLYNGANVPQINNKDMVDLKIPVPSLEEQDEIIRILDELLPKERQIKETAEAVIEQIDIMKKAILARAFRGELGTNDPSEESAVELLKSILSRDEQLQISTKKPSKRVSIPSDTRVLLSNVREEEIIKLLLKSVPQSISIQEIMALSAKKFELMDALRTLEKKQLITKNEFGEYSLTR